MKEENRQKERLEQNEQIPVEKRMDEEREEEQIEESGEEEIEEMEEAIQEETQEEPKAQVKEEPEEQVQEEPEGTQLTPEEIKKKKNAAGIMVTGLLIVAIIIGVCWKAIYFRTDSPDLGVTYAKENNLYVYDLQQESYLAQEGISNGGQYNFFYTAWGNTFSKEGDTLYYIANLKENNHYDLYARKTADSKEGKLVAKNVSDYHISADGQKAAFLRVENPEDGAELYLYDGTKEVAIDKQILPQTEAYEISTDGAYITYIKEEKTGNHLYICGTQEKDKPFLLAENVSLFMMAKESNVLYYVAPKKEGTYAAYSYTYGNSPTEILSGVTYMEVMENGKDVLLMAKNEEKKIPYTQIIEDDMAKKDAELKETKGKAYEAKQARDKIREAMNQGEGIAPLLQECYILTKGDLLQITDSALSAVSLPHKHPYALYYGMTDEKIKISEISSLEEVEMAYYMALASGDKYLHIANAGGKDWTLEDENIDPSTIRLSADGIHIAYMVGKEEPQGRVLKMGRLGNTIEKITDNASQAEFLGHSNKLAYLKDFAEGEGTLGVTGQEEIKNTSGVYFAKDRESVYYITDINPKTGNGTLYVNEKGQQKKLDENVFSIQYKNNGHLVYFKNYDYEAGVGDLYYYDGKEPKEIDSGVTSVFM